MIRLGKLSNKFQKRTLRAVYGQTQAYPYAATLDDSFRAADGSFVAPVVAGSSLPTRTAAAALYKGSLLPGLVVTQVPGQEKVKVAAGADAVNTGEVPFGLLANFVGGELDELGDENDIGVWRSGQGGVFEVLAPAFGTVAIAATRAGAATPLYAGADGRLTTVSPHASAVVVANLLQVVGTSRILIDLKV